MQNPAIGGEYSHEQDKRLGDALRLRLVGAREKLLVNAILLLQSRAQCGLDLCKDPGVLYLRAGLPVGHFLFAAEVLRG